MRRFLHWLVGHLSHERVIYDRDGMSAYLSRWYLRGRPKHPAGEPFDRFGAMRPGTTPVPGIGVYLHRFHRSDADQALHNHPWRWAVSLVLVGGYVEERREQARASEGDFYRVVRRVVGPWSLNFIRHGDFHRVDLLERDAWTLFIVGPKVSEWGFWDRHTGTYTPWQKFIVSESAEGQA